MLTIISLIIILCIFIITWSCDEKITKLQILRFSNQIILLDRSLHNHLGLFNNGVHKWNANKQTNCVRRHCPLMLLIRLRDCHILYILSTILITNLWSHQLVVRYPRLPQCLCCNTCNIQCRLVRIHGGF